MGITKEIRIEGNLIEGSKIQIYYRGKFTKEYSENVYLVWGYGQGWKDIQEKQMTWLNDGFFAEIELTSYGELNFCFKNNFGTWDNNNGLDYSVIIETKKEVFHEEVIEVETEPVVEELVEEKNEIIEEIIEEPVVIKKVKEEKRKEKNKFKLST